MSEDKIKKLTLGAMGAIVAVLLLWAVFGSRGNGAPVGADIIADVQPDAEVAEADAAVAHDSADADEVPWKPEVVRDETYGHSPAAIADALLILMPDDTVRLRNRYEAHFDSMPPGGVKMHINLLGETLGRVFNDSNYLHIAAAEAIGIKPLSGIREAWEAGARLERLQSCEEYYLDNLTHSLPYLVPRAHRLLRDIGAAFRDSLQARGGGDYRIKVTSVLRTPRLVNRLRRRNVNAVDTSAHLFGTTFDISYAKFICDSTRMPRTQEDMKNLLGEVVYAMRQQGRCYVKYERKQACFHITAR